VFWPSIIERGIAVYGWQTAMLAYAGVVLVCLLPLLPLLHAVPAPVSAGPAVKAGTDRSVLGMAPNLVQALICVAGFCCCIPMAIPSSHLVAFCSDIGIAPTQGAAMLSVLLGCAFLSRQFWGAMADRIGGLRTVMAGSALQALAIAAFLLTQNEVGLFVISGAYGLGFSGIIPSYSVAIGDLFPSAEAGWRIPTFLFTAMSGMAVGSWGAGWLYDHFGTYAPAFAMGVVFNVLNLILLGFLVTRPWRRSAEVFARV
jgi:MFS family permease